MLFQTRSVFCIVEILFGKCIPNQSLPRPLVWQGSVAVICTVHACTLRVDEKFSRLVLFGHFLCLQEMLHGNIRQNETVFEESGGFATAFPFVWGQTKVENLEEAWQRLDIILAADVIYHRELFDPLLSALSDLGECGGHLVTFS